MSWEHEAAAAKPLAKPVTLPPLAGLAQAQDDPDAIERKELAAKLAEQRVVRQGQEAIELVGRSTSFELWLRVGRGLLVGEKLAIAQAGNDWGQTYSKIFSAWIRRHHFDRTPGGAPARSVAIELAEHADQITAWRDSLPKRQRRRLIHPLSVTRWRAPTGQYQAQRFRDARWEAECAWRRFVACVKSLPAEQAGRLWEMAYTEAAAHA